MYKEKINEYNKDFSSKENLVKYYLLVLFIPERIGYVGVVKNVSF